MKIPDIIKIPPNRVWRTYTGGKVLDIMEGKDNPHDDHFPEDWIVSTTHAVNKGREDFVKEGLSGLIIDDKNYYLQELLEKHAKEILGVRHFKKYDTNPQFLLKYLDSAIRLHIQVHPTIDFAKKYLNSNSGKTEAYVILSIRDEVQDPYIYLGFQNRVNRESFKMAVSKQDENKILSFFEKILVKPGDVFIVPGGLPHAIGEGVFMIEIMEPTDLVVRLEFERGGYLLPEPARFMGRGIDFAMDIVDFNCYSQDDIKTKYFCSARLFDKQDGGNENILIDEKQTNCFSVHRLNVKGGFVKQADSFYTGIVNKGSGMVLTKDEEYRLIEGDRFLIPYKSKNIEYKADDEMEIILTFPPH